MSRTHAHAPERVELEHTNPTLLSIRHSHQAVPSNRSCPHPDARCAPSVPRWLTTQRWSRRGTATLERRASVRDALLTAAKTYRAGGDLDLDVLPTPERYCLCQTCGAP